MKKTILALAALASACLTTTVNASDFDKTVFERPAKYQYYDASTWNLAVTNDGTPEYIRSVPGQVTPTLSFSECTNVPGLKFLDTAGHAGYSPEGVFNSAVRSQNMYNTKSREMVPGSWHVDTSTNECWLNDKTASGFTSANVSSVLGTIEYADGWVATLVDEERRIGIAINKWQSGDWYDAGIFRGDDIVGGTVHYLDGCSNLFGYFYVKETNGVFATLASDSKPFEYANAVIDAANGEVVNGMYYSSATDTCELR